MEKRSNGADPCRPETIGIRQLAAEISLGLRSPVTVRAGEVHGGEPGKQLSRLYAYMRAYNAASVGRNEERKTARKVGTLGRP